MKHPLWFAWCCCTFSGFYMVSRGEGSGALAMASLGFVVLFLIWRAGAKELSNGRG